MLLKNQLSAKEDICKEIMNDKKMFLLEGPSGSGKTYIMNKIVEELTQNEQFECFKLEGDSQCVERDFYPFFKSLNDQKAKEFQNALKKIAPKALKSVPFVGNLSEAVIETVINRKEEHFRALNSYLNDEEKNILYRLQYYMNKDKKFIFSIENIHWWDTKSLDLFYQILKEKDSNLDFIKNSIFLITFTTDQETQNKNKIKDIKEKFKFDSYSLMPVDKIDYKEALASLGMNNHVSTDMVNALYSSTGGHLHLTKQIILHINTSLAGNSQNLNMINLPQINNFIENRLERFGADGELITEVLKYASIIGLSFTYLELENATKKRRDEIQRIVIGAKKLHLVEVNEKKLNFAHEIIRELFYNKLSENSASYYQSCAECLQMIKPNEYKTRANYLLKSGLFKEASTIYLIYYLSKVRKKEVFNLAAETEVSFYAKELQAEEFMEIMMKSYELYHQQDFEKAIIKLRFIENLYPPVLLAERDYLLALCLNKKIDESSRNESVEILKTYQKIESVDHEGELWSRILSLQIISYIHINDKNTARKCEKQLVAYFTKQQNFDMDIEDKINILRRKSSAIHSIEFSTRSTEKSMKYFGPTEVGGFPLNPIEYYYSLNNHVANLMVSGDFNESHNYSKVLLKFTENTQGIIFPRTEVVINNYIVTGYLTKKVNSSKGLQLFETVFQNSKSSSDMILIKNNYASLLACNGDFDTSKEKFLELQQVLKEKSNIETYYEYCINSNLLVVEYLMGNYEDSKRLFDTLLKNPIIGEEDYYRTRQNFLTKLFEENNASSSLLLKDICTLNIYDSNGIYSLEQMKEVYTKGFLFSDIQFWSES